MRAVADSTPPSRRHCAGTPGGGQCIERWRQRRGALTSRRQQRSSCRACLHTLRLHSCSGGRRHEWLPAALMQAPAARLRWHMAPAPSPRSCYRRCKDWASSVLLTSTPLQVAPPRCACLRVLEQAAVAQLRTRLTLPHIAPVPAPPLARLPASTVTTQTATAPPARAGAAQSEEHLRRPRKVLLQRLRGCGALPAVQPPAWAPLHA